MAQYAPLYTAIGLYAHAFGAVPNIQGLTLAAQQRALPHILKAIATRSHLSDEELIYRAKITAADKGTG